MERIICHCNFIEIDEIVAAIKDEGARTIQDIRNLTGANTGCGRCENAVMAILRKELAKLDAENNEQQNKQKE
jgi:NAD(P)H-nitrite reductase large subunit